jgi:2-keto-4-pentenoate hydratase/2-oxohepta-3-ene-1,7-dioic acid hydratase in catechol pathway
VRQHDTTAGLIFPVAELVSYLSSMLTLYPGDLIFTGTPSGVGVATGTFLRRGDVVRTTIGGIGTLTNRCV